MAETRTAGANLTVFGADGKIVCPCRCGETHRGDYAYEEWHHHNCFHQADLIGLPAEENAIQAICPECGMSWKVNLEG